MFAEVDLNLMITSNVDYPVQINILGNPYNLLDTSNAKTEYRYDLTAFTFGTENQVSIEYKANGAATYNTFYGQFNPQSLQAVVDVLNILGIGFFTLYTSGGNTYIGTYNQNFTFGNLNIFSPTSSTIISPTFVYGTGFDAPLNSLITQADGKVVCVGSFTTYNGTATPGYVVRLNNNGTIDNTFVVTTGFDLAPTSLAQQADGKIVFIGGFTDYNGNTVKSIARINTNGSYDATFIQGGGVGGVCNKIKIQTDQKILIAGGFSMNYDGNTGSLIRILPNGTIDGTFTLGQVGGPSFIPQIVDFVIQADGKYVIVGDFNQYALSGVVGYGIIRVNTNGTYDNTLVTGVGFDFQPTCVAIQTDQKLLVGGFFTSYKGSTCAYAIRIASNGNVDSVFTGTSFDSSVTSILYLTSGKFVLSGAFTTYNGTSANGIIRLNSDTTKDTTWNYGTGFGGTGQGVLTANTAQTLYNVGGTFTMFDGVSANYIVQLLS